MKRFLLLGLPILALAAWWAVHTQSTPHADTAVYSETATYPADFPARLARVTGCRLELGAPLPGGSQWISAEGHPVPGHPDARPGGCVRLSNAGPFPAHFLRFGGSVQFFHQNLLAATEIPLVARHPLTGETTAGVAEAWYSSGNTHYFRLNPAARYNNGQQVRAADYLLAALLQAEQHCGEYEALSHAATVLKTHGEHMLSITMREKGHIADAAALLMPAEPGFYAGFDSRFRALYARRIPPATGPYRVSRVQRGRLVELQRIPDWWGQDLPLCRHRFNAAILEFHFLTSEAQVWEFFLHGKLDALQTRNMAAWQDRLAEHPELPTLEYEAEYPLPPYGIAANTRTLPDPELRRGLLQAMDMDKAVELMTRGEGSRLSTFHSGYRALSPDCTPQYHFSPEAARACFARAGYTIPGTDGILRRGDGTRLSVSLLYSPNEKISALLATLIRSAADCGAEIVPEAVPWQTCHRRLMERSHQLAFWAVPAPVTPDPRKFFAPDADPAFSPFGLDSAAMNEALETGKLDRIDHLVYSLAIWLPGWKENRVCLVHQPRLRIPPSPWCYDALDSHLFWVEPTP